MIGAGSRRVGPLQWRQPHYREVAAELIFSNKLRHLMCRLSTHRSQAVRRKLEVGKLEVVNANGRELRTLKHTRSVLLLPRRFDLARSLKQASDGAHPKHDAYDSAKGEIERPRIKQGLKRITHIHPFL
jgi:hypothetical protein